MRLRAAAVPAAAAAAGSVATVSPAPRDRMEMRVAAPEWQALNARITLVFIVHLSNRKSTRAHTRTHRHRHTHSQTTYEWGRVALVPVRNKALINWMDWGKRIRLQVRFWSAQLRVEWAEQWTGGRLLIEWEDGHELVFKNRKMSINYSGGGMIMAL